MALIVVVIDICLEKVTGFLLAFELGMSNTCACSSHQWILLYLLTLSLHTNVMLKFSATLELFHFCIFFCCFENRQPTDFCSGCRTKQCVYSLQQFHSDTKVRL